MECLGGTIIRGKILRPTHQQLRQVPHLRRPRVHTDLERTLQGRFLLTMPKPLQHLNLEMLVVRVRHSNLPHKTLPMHIRLNLKEIRPSLQAHFLEASTVLQQW